MELLRESLRGKERKDALDEIGERRCIRRPSNEREPRVRERAGRGALDGEARVLILCIAAQREHAEFLADRLVAPVLRRERVRVHRCLGGLAACEHVHRAPAVRVDVEARCALLRVLFADAVEERQLLAREREDPEVVGRHGRRVAAQQFAASTDEHERVHERRENVAAGRILALLREICRCKFLHCRVDFRVLFCVVQTEVMHGVQGTDTQVRQHPEYARHFLEARREDDERACVEPLPRTGQYQRQGTQIHGHLERCDPSEKRLYRKDAFGYCTVQLRGVDDVDGYCA